MNLSERLYTLASLVDLHSCVADIGTDHGYLPLYLYKEKIAKKVILADVSKGSLDKARESCKEAFPDVTFDLRLGDGLDVIKAGEVDTVILAGMGGILMTEILDWDMEKTASISTFIFQPRNNVGYLRKWLDQRSFTIIKEVIAKEGKVFCPILKVKSPGLEALKDLAKKDSCFCLDKEEEYIRDYLYPDRILDAGTWSKSYISSELNKERLIRDRIIKGAKDYEHHPDFLMSTKKIKRLEELESRL